MKLLKPEEFRWDVPLADEVLMETVPDIPYMSENFCFTGYDPVSRIGYYLHMGRWIGDPEVLREMLMVWLPNGSVLWAQAFGRGDCTLGPNVACGRLICEEPGKRIRIRYSGPMQLIRPAELVSPDPRPQVLHKVEVDLLFTGRWPSWYYPSTDNSSWARFHTEQLGGIKGFVQHRETKYAVDGVAYRDHSRGPRNLTDLRGHTWIQGQFPGGEAFCFYRVWLMVDGKEVQALSEAKILRDGRFVSARVTSAPRGSTSLDVLQDFDIELQSESGTMKMHAIPKALSFYSFGPTQSHYLPGIPYGALDFPLQNIEQPTEFRLDGKIGHGHTERSYYRADAESASDPAKLRAAYLMHQ
jgi:hypothetical protein